MNNAPQTKCISLVPREEEDEKECVNARADWGHAKVDEVPWGPFLNNIHKMIAQHRAGRHSRYVFLLFCHLLSKMHSVCLI